MSGTILLKKGDSFKISVTYKQSDGTAVDLTGFTLLVKARDIATKNIELFSISSEVVTPNASITFTDIVSGQFNVLIINTDTFKLGSYIVDIQYTDADGIKQTSKAFGLKVVDKL